MSNQANEFLMLGRTDAFDDYYRSDLTGLVRFLLHLGASIEDAQEIAQEAMLAVLRKWRDVEDPWAYTRATAKTIFMRRLSKSKRDQEAAKRAWIPEQLRAPFISFAAEVESVMQMLHTLPLEQREVMAWTLDGYTPSQIAKATNQKPATVRSHLRHARAALKKQLARNSSTSREEE
ncbi:sigma-70 family RNA polymerase sigma factor [Actinomadura logoneensis]|uniref:Sigma-70 family RNA polymerase sigma factor n=1 Tax=Actinomadura logoneensis TaxID=2293572 RepID=A0A372JMM8_9ACTN|nr:sigma-70 family RNA polymerase sigma factor [Actinomadura logoneensis]RFU41210.1 sigma-70 family RNA polymerase sigma factor [Actinomadura logoneensis]